MKLRALSELALQIDRSAESLRQVLDNRQPQTGSAHVTRAGSVDAVETFEDSRLLLWSDSDAGVDHADDCLLYTSPSPRDQRGSRMPSSA